MLKLPLTLALPTSSLFELLADFPLMLPLTGAAGEDVEALVDRGERGDLDVGRCEAGEGDLFRFMLKLFSVLSLLHYFFVVRQKVRLSIYFEVNLKHCLG